MSSGSISLAEVATHTEVLAIACSRCDRAGRYRLDTLIARHGPDFGIPGFGVLSRLSSPIIVGRCADQSLHSVCMA